MSLLRQGRSFVAVGVLQWLVDWSVMFALSRAGVSVAAANVAGRMAGALLGFWLNGNYTFAQDAGRPGWRQLGRYVLLWCTSTVFSTAGVSAIDALFGLRGAWLGKPLVDGALALGSFLASRHWVYR
ncbi:GtrA family protein [Dokdonella sp.]|uniref:GtrA family protein n=1 Tax=Dokdonella sp. TaxID=2291710 RepID=UPI002F402D86